MTIGERIKRRREELGITQDHLASLMGYKSRSSINKIEIGTQNLTQSKIKKLADALQTTPSYIMGWDDEITIVTEEEQAILDKINALPPSQRKHLLGLLGIEE